jgi:dihydropyrimidinase
MQEWDLVIRDALVVTPTGPRQGSVAVKEGQIVRVGVCLGDGKENIDATGKILFPGCIDPHTHLGNQGAEKFSELMYEESAAAAIGGVTTLVTTTLIGTDSLNDYLSQAIEICKGRSFIDHKFTLSTLTESHVEEFSDLINRGGNLYKHFMGYKGAEAEYFGMPAEGLNLGFLYRSFEMLTKCGSPALPMIHAEEPFLGDEFRDKALQSTGSNELQKWNEASPADCELIDIYKAAVVAKAVGALLYVVHVSAGESVDLLRHLQENGYKIIGETCLHYLVTNTDASQALGVYAKVKPPIRTRLDSEKLWEGLWDGTITTVGTDTVPYKKEQKLGADFWSAPPGVGSGIGVLLPVMFSEGFVRRRLPLEKLAKVLAENTAKAIGVYPQKGAIAEGFDADLVIIDPEQEMTIRADALRGGSDYSIYEGFKVRGVPVKTFVRGKLVASEGKIVADSPEGKFLIGERAYPTGI